MGQPDFGQSAAPPIPHHLHDDGDAVDGDAIEGIQHGLPVKNDPFCVLALYRDQLDA